MSWLSPSVTLRLWIHRLVCGVVWVLTTVAGWIGSWTRTERDGRPMICVEAGSQGWELIEYHEIWQSATEYFGANNVIRHDVSDRKRYVRASCAVVRDARPHLYWVDPRSGAQQSVRAVAQSLALALVFAWYGVRPIAWLANGPNRIWRLQAEMLTTRDGACFVFMHPRLGGIRFAHRRVHGPCIFPLSLATLRRLQSKPMRERVVTDPVVSFVGSLYEPRRSQLLELQDVLAQRGIALRLISPEITGKRLTNEEYWNTLLESDILVTTADHVKSDSQDFVREPHLVFRYTEALAAGAALVAPVVQGSEELIRSGQDYLGLESLSDAAEKIAWLCSHPERIERISRRGHGTMTELVESRWFWRTVTQALALSSQS